MSSSDRCVSTRAEVRAVASAETPGAPPRPPLGAGGASAQVTAPATARWVPPLHSADHPATPWWSALFRGGRGAVAGAMTGGGEVERRAGRGWR